MTSIVDFIFLPLIDTKFPQQDFYTFNINHRCHYTKTNIRIQKYINFK